MAIKNKDFIEIEYTGSITSDGTIFDTTDEELAKKEGIYDEHAPHGAKIVVIGEGHIIKGIDDFLIGKEPGEYELDIPPKDAFGSKNPKLLRIIPTKHFSEADIKPFPGLQVNIDGDIGTIKTVSGGRTIVDFNHPLSGHELHYKIKVTKIIEDEELKLKTVLNVMMNGLPKHEFKEGILKINIKGDIPEEMSKMASDKIKELVKSVKEVQFVKGN